MNALDYAVMLGLMLGIAIYGAMHSRGRRDLDSYMKGRDRTRWFVIGISVMATQASAVTFISTPGQGFADGLKFIQNYFGAPFALIIIAIFFLPIFKRLNVYTAYEYLGKRFDGRARMLAVALFLVQRGFAAAITIYAPAIVLSAVFGWPLTATIVASGVVVTAYTIVGGCDAVNTTQKYQFAVVCTGMIIAYCVLMSKLPAELTVGDAFHVAGAFGKLNAVDMSPSFQTRYTFWSGLLGGLFLALSYFGADQSQVQRYIAGTSLRESRLGLMFNALFKIPMQFLILLLGAMLFVFYQFNPQPIAFNQSGWARATAVDAGRTGELERAWSGAHSEGSAALGRWVLARRAGDDLAASATLGTAREAGIRAAKARTEAVELVKAASPQKSNDNDYAFIYFILNHLPHGLIGLLVSVFFASTLSSKSGELTALGSTMTIDVYKNLIVSNASEVHYVRATKWFTALWGLIAVGFAIFIQVNENLIQAQNIVASLIYGVILGLFVVAFLFRWIGGTAVFLGGLLAQLFVVIGYYTVEISYLWYNPIGCGLCVLFAAAIQAAVGGAANSTPDKPITAG